MTKIIPVAFTVMAGFLTVAPACLAEQNPYAKPYDATYDYYMPSGPTTMRLSSDGQGHLRTETNLGDRRQVSITDWNQKLMYSIDDQSRSINKMDYRSAPGGAPIDESKKTSLGDKVVEGKNCEGWQYITNNRTSQAWVDKDTGATVLMTIDGKPQMKLRSLNPGSIPAQYFQIPSGYRVQDLNQQMRRAQELAKKYQNQPHR